MMYIVHVWIICLIPRCFAGFGESGYMWHDEAADNCPRECICKGRKIDCSYRNMGYIPKPISAETERLDLQGNNLTVIKRSDFAGLKHLRILQLMENNIRMVEKGSFEDLSSMERLRLNKNLLTDLPDLLFASMPRLYRLDLSDNKLRTIGRKTLKGSPLLKNLQLDNNELTCITDASIRGLRNMEKLTINKNNITTFPKDLFQGMTKLRVLRINENALVCDCHLGWLGKWLRQNPTLALFTKCNSPRQYHNMQIAELQHYDFKCNGVENIHPQECLSEKHCPRQCICTEGIVDCREKGLTELPDNIPDSATELRLEQNQISEIPAKAFVEFKRLRRIDLSNNQITSVAAGAFTGLKSLNSLVLYGNKITDLPPGIFQSLPSLQLLLLNANKITCVRADTFSDLHNLNLLSLYDNKIQSLVNGTFTPLHNIQTLLRVGRWWTRVDPLLTTLTSNLYLGSEVHRTKNAGSCLIDRDCPRQCVCTGTVVDCSARRLLEIPQELPMFTSELKLMDNEITRIDANGLFKRLPNIQVIDLRNNKIDAIEDGAFDGADKLKELQLTGNRLSRISEEIFHGLKHLETLALAQNRITCIHNDTFTDLASLRLLSLFDNQIRCVMPRSFDRLRYLSTLNLMNNPFICNCHLRWLSEWLKVKQRNIITGSPSCLTPHSLKNIRIQDINPKNFVCEEDNEIGCNIGTPQCCSKGPLDENSCDTRAYCPPMCHCTGTVVRCNRKKLKEIPQDIPLDTTELYMDENYISDIAPGINRLKKLIRLDMSKNHLVNLPAYIFANLTQLSTLILSDNQLQCVASTAFAGLMKLRILTLHGNNLSAIPYGTFDDLHILSHFAFGDNPLYCDCNLKWLSDFIKKDFIESGTATCTGPKTMINQKLLTSESFNFECFGDPDPRILSKCNVCYTNPCMNDAVCRPVAFKNYTCDCTPGFHGRKCQHIIDACFGNPCGNKGTCEVLEMGRFTCHCATGFEGDRCETNINDCIDHKCLHDGVCIDGVESYNCSCTPQYTGPYCEKKIHFCVGRYDFCMNGGTCIDLNSDYRCVCPEGFTGKNCSHDIDDCKSHICQHGASCIDGVSTYKCLCPAGYSGKYCEIAPIVLLPFPKSGVCQNHECQNNGVCYQSPGSIDYSCKCAPGFDGKNCEKLSIISFHEKDSYIQLPRMAIKMSINITIVLSTHQTSGIVLYYGQEQHLAVEVFRGRIRVSFDVGNYPVSTLYSYEKINDGLFHTIEMFINRKNFTLRIDGDIARTIINEGSKEYLDVNDSIYLGGLPSDVNTRAFKKWQIRDGTSFNGCFKKVYMNARQVDFVSAELNHKVLPGCYKSEPLQMERDVCDNNQCHYGKCIANGDDYNCLCKRGYSGQVCDIAPTCWETTFKDKYMDPKTKCKSRKRVKHRLCEGSCGKYCCKPRKIKNIKLRLFCDDGSNFVYELPVIRKCGCQKC